MVHESESSATVRRTNDNNQMAEDETINFLHCFLLLVLQVLHLLQNSETLKNLTRNHPASSNQTIRPSTISSSVSKDSSALLEPELERIRSKHAVLASTGCTRDFCQSGRMVRTDEPRGTYILEGWPFFMIAKGWVVRHCWKHCPCTTLS